MHPKEEVIPEHQKESNKLRRAKKKQAKELLDLINGNHSLYVPAMSGLNFSNLSA